MPLTSPPDDYDDSSVNGPRSAATAAAGAAALPGCVNDDACRRHPDPEGSGTLQPTAVAVVRSTD